ncbi:TniB family NTP-binding protein [Streptomyces sp. NPDC050732]|uniref:TniB family NTP-binding protein n=1 Tax=Streptomyces sp. NPDC050732 TaxID=3154632 RepID=UPI00343A403E
MSIFRHPGLAEPHTKEEWRRYRDNRPPERPTMPPYQVYLKLSQDDRDDLNEDRDIYHSALAIIDTEQVKRLHYLIKRRMKANAERPAGARAGLVFDGPPTVGKSTLVKLFAARHENRLRRKYPEKFREGYEANGMLIDYTPVVYLSIPARATPKDLSVLLADYLGMVQRGRGTQTDITNHVLSVLADVGTELVIIDDVHFLDLSAKEGRVVNDHLKYIANKTAATFVYTGVDLKKSGLFLEGQAASRATQTSGRYTHHAVRKFGCTTDKDKLEWAQTVKALEDTLVLYRHKPGQLVKLSQYLYDRTDGSICALTDLLRESAIEAVMSEEEAVTRKLMDRVEISEYAQATYRNVVRQRRRTTPVRTKPAAS